MSIQEKSTKVKAPDLIVEALSDLGVDHIFHLPGTSVASIYGSLTRQNKIKSFLFKHEQGACFAAAGYALVTNRPGVCMVMCGPGVTNLVSAVAEAYYQSIPMVIITVDNPKENLGIEDFHEVDSFSMLAPVTKKIFHPERVEDLQKVIAEAVYCAAAGRPGPVYLNIPVNLMGQAAPKKNITLKKQPSKPSITVVRKFLKLMSASQAPVIFAGSGVIKSGAEKELSEFVTLTGIPVFTSIGGRGAMPEDRPLVIGMPSYTFDVSFLNAADLFIVLGTRLNPVNLRMGRLKLPEKLLQVDSAAENPKFRKADIYVQSDIKDFLTVLNSEIRTAGSYPSHTGSRLYDIYKKTYSEFTADAYRAIRHSAVPLTAKKFMLALSAFLDKKAATLFTDSIWIPYGHLLPRVRTPRSFFSMRSFGCLGFALPAALGACLAYPNKKVISLSGDGAFLFNCQELSTAATYKLNNFIQIILNNSGFASLGNIADSMFPGQDRYYQWSSINYQRFAESFGIKTITIESPAQINGALTKAFSGNGPYVIRVITDDREKAQKPFWIEKE